MGAIASSRAMRPGAWSGADPGVIVVWSFAGWESLHQSEPSGGAHRAQIHDRANLRRRPGRAAERRTVRGGEADLADPLHCTVRPEAHAETAWRSGAHPAVGGIRDVPCSADLLPGALVACQETTLRMVATNAGIDLEELEITAEADWDPRGTLAMGREFTIGLTAIRATPGSPSAGTRVASAPSGSCGVPNGTVSC